MEPPYTEAVHLLIKETQSRLGRGTSSMPSLSASQKHLPGARLVSRDAALLGHSRALLSATKPTCHVQNARQESLYARLTVAPALGGCGFPGGGGESGAGRFLTLASLFALCAPGLQVAKFCAVAPGRSEAKRSGLGRSGLRPDHPQICRCETGLPPLYPPPPPPPLPQSQDFRFPPFENPLLQAQRRAPDPPREQEHGPSRSGRARSGGVPAGGPPPAALQGVPALPQRAAPAGRGALTISEEAIPFSKTKEDAENVLSFIIFICFIASKASSFLTVPLLTFLLALCFFFAYSLKLNEKVKATYWLLAHFLCCVVAAIIYFAISIAAVSKYSDGASKAAGVFGFIATIVYAVDFYVTFNGLVTSLKQSDSTEAPGQHQSEDEASDSDSD